MDWHQLDLPTKAAFVATALAVLSVLVPPISMAMALLAIVFSGIAVGRARRGGSSNRLARICLTMSSGLIVLVVVGSAIYASGS